MARLLGLQLNPHGGAVLEALARQGDPAVFKFKVPMRRWVQGVLRGAGVGTKGRCGRGGGCVVVRWGC